MRPTSSVNSVNARASSAHCSPLGKPKRMRTMARQVYAFAVAKAVGMRVERFSLFFPPTLFRVRRGETEYAIGAIPAGGYVKITGMSPDEVRDLVAAVVEPPRLSVHPADRRALPG